MENLDNLDFFDQQPPTPRRLKKYIFTFIICIAVVVVGILGYKFFASRNLEKPAYHILFLEGGQTYFGKIESEDNDYITLSRAHYLQVAERDERDARGRVVKVPSISAVRVGTETHAPKTTIRVVRDRVMIIEELESTSQFVGLIEQSAVVPQNTEQIKQ